MKEEHITFLQEFHDLVSEHGTETLDKFIEAIEQCPRYQEKPDFDGKVYMTFEGMDLLQPLEEVRTATRNLKAVISAVLEQEKRD